jgi:hypothetical protein
MMTEEITPWLAKLSAGDPRAAQVIWDRATTSGSSG